MRRMEERAREGPEKDEKTMARRKENACSVFIYSLLLPVQMSVWERCRGDAHVCVSRERDYVCDSLAKFSWRLPWKNRINF